MVDPRHPLYGRRFPLEALIGGSRSEAFARVRYRPGILLMLPITATSLRPRPWPEVVAAKLSVAGLRELVALAGEGEGACPSSPPTSGRRCRRRSAGTPPRISPPSCAR